MSHLSFALENRIFLKYYLENIYILIVFLGLFKTINTLNFNTTTTFKAEPTHTKLWVRPLQTCTARMYIQTNFEKLHPLCCNTWAFKVESHLSIHTNSIQVSSAPHCDTFSQEESISSKCKLNFLQRNKMCCRLYVPCMYCTDAKSSLSSALPHFSRSKIKICKSCHWNVT